MSNTFSLVCDETKQKLWVGQGWEGMTTFYSGTPDVMQRLGRFLEATRGKALRIRCDDADETHGDYEEFEEPEDESEP